MVTDSHRTDAGEADEGKADGRREADERRRPMDVGTITDRFRDQAPAW
jgi:hypothetical protein